MLYWWGVLLIIYSFNLYKPFCEKHKMKCKNKIKQTLYSHLTDSTLVYLDTLTFSVLHNSLYTQQFRVHLY